MQQQKPPPPPPRMKAKSGSDNSSNSNINNNIQLINMPMDEKIKSFVQQQNKTLNLCIMTPFYAGTTTVRYMCSLMNTLTFCKTFEIPVTVEFCQVITFCQKAVCELLFFCRTTVWLHEHATI